MILSIIIVSWNTKDLLAGCISSILANPPDCEYEIWVVDNASTDGSLQLVRESFPEVRLIESRENVGFARANNLAIRQSTGMYVLLLNTDTEVKPGALQTLIHFMSEHAAAGGAGPYLLNPDGSLQVSCYPLPTLGRELWRLFHLDSVKPYGIYDMSRWQTDAARPVGVLKGACMILRREALNQAGLMDEDYFMYTEEVDLCYRFHQSGWPLYWVPQAKVVHFGGQSIEQVPDEMFLLLYKTKIIYFRKHYGGLASLAFKLVILAAILPRVLLGSLAWLKRAEAREQYLRLARNYQRLLAALPGM
jgi:GT2 family glycosyltransferase